MSTHILLLFLGCRDGKVMEETSTVVEEPSNEPEDSSTEGELPPCSPELRSLNTSWSVTIGGAIRLQGEGGSGDYRWVVSSETPYGFVDAQSGLFTSTATEVQDAIVTLSDVNCSDTVDVTVSVTDRFALSPSYAMVAPQDVVQPDFFGGSGTQECHFVINVSGSSLDESCVYTAGPTDGKDVIQFIDSQTDEFQNMTIDVVEGTQLNVWGDELILPQGADFRLSTLGGSGIVEFTSPDQSIITVDSGIIHAVSPGEVTIDIQDARVPSMHQQITVQVVSQHAYQAEPWNAVSQYPHGKVADINNDGWNDLLISNPQGGHGDEPYSGNILIFLGHSTGFDTEPIQQINGFFRNESFGAYFETDDINGDGATDLVAGINNVENGGLRVFYGDPATGLIDEKPTMVLRGASVQLCDMGNDGVIDILTNYQALYSMIYRPVSNMFTPLNTESLNGIGRCADWNGDGVVDIIMIQRSYDGGYVYNSRWLMGVQGGSFVETNIGLDFELARSDGNVGRMGTLLKDIDVNGDGTPGLGFLVSLEQFNIWGISDQLTDLGYTVNTGGMIFFDGFETDETVESYRTRSEYDLVVVGEFTSFKQHGNYFGFYRDGEYHIGENLELLPSLADSNGVVEDISSLIIWSGLPASGHDVLFLVDDIDNDNIPDFVTYHQNTRRVALYGYETTGGQTTDLTYSSMAAAGEKQGTGVAVVQFEGDTVPSMVIGRPVFESNSPIILTAQRSDPTWTTPVADETLSSYLFSVGSNYVGSQVLTEDFNGDGYLDLLISDNAADSRHPSCGSSSNGGFYVYLGGPNGVSKELSFILPKYLYYGLETIAIGDHNGDSYPDFLTRNQYYGLQMFWGLEEYTIETDSSCGEWISHDMNLRQLAPIGDLDQDGCDDYAQIISFANPDGSWWGSSSVYIFYGYGGSTCRSTPSFSAFKAGSGYYQGYNGLASSNGFDMDGDGITDIALTTTTQFSLSSKGALHFIPGSYFSTLPTYEWDGLTIPSAVDTQYETLPNETASVLFSPDVDSGFGSIIKAVSSADGQEHWVALGRARSQHAGHESGSWELFRLENGAWKSTPDLVISGTGNDPDSLMGTVLETSIIDGSTWFAVGQPKSDLVGVDSGAVIGFTTSTIE